MVDVVMLPSSSPSTPPPLATEDSVVVVRMLSMPDLQDARSALSFPFLLVDSSLERSCWAPLVSSFFNFLFFLALVRNGVNFRNFFFVLGASSPLNDADLLDDAAAETPESRIDVGLALAP